MVEWSRPDGGAGAGRLDGGWYADRGIRLRVSPHWSVPRNRRHSTQLQAALRRRRLVPRRAHARGALLLQPRCAVEAAGSAEPRALCRRRGVSLTIAVVGASGVYGRHLVPRLLERGHRVRALVPRP